MGIQERGFASMDRTKQREIASKGGRAAHVKGTAHEWTREEAQEAARKGVMAKHRRREEPQPQELVPEDRDAPAQSPDASPRHD